MNNCPTIHEGYKVDKRYIPPMYKLVYYGKDTKDVVEYLERKGGGFYRNNLHKFEFEVEGKDFNMTKVICGGCGKELEFAHNNPENTYEVEPCDCVCVNQNYIDITNEFFYSNDLLVGGDDKVIKENFNTINEKLKAINDLEESINKIIPEYRHVPFQYKVLLFKERVNTEYVTSKSYFLKGSELDELARALSKGSIIVFIKLIRESLKIGLKDAKEFTECRLSREDFKAKPSFEEAKKMIIDKF